MCTWNNEKETVLFIWASFSSEKFSLAVYDFCDVLFEKTGLHVPCLYLYSDKAVINAIFFQMSHKPTHGKQRALLRAKTKSSQQRMISRERVFYWTAIKANLCFNYKANPPSEP